MIMRAKMGKRTERLLERAKADTCGTVRVCIFALIIIVTALIADIYLDLKEVARGLQAPPEIQPCGFGGFQRIGGVKFLLPLEWYPEHLKAQKDSQPCMVETIPMDIELE